ncbi:MAG: histidine kinase [Bacteroidales bacterium]|jgi:sensor histidine kinase YesM|nr:histidine kinase [Bacteroidales bacterium]
MNGNPIFSNYRSRILYSGIWWLISGSQMLMVYWGTELPFGYILLDTFVFNLLFSILIIPLWFPVRFNRWERQTWHFILIAHLALAIAYLTVCLTAGYLITLPVALTDSAYLDFLNNSILWKLVEGELFYIIAILIYYLYVYVERLNEKATNEIRLNKLLKDGELNLLKSQINPHFLFNSLNSVNSRIITHPEKAQQMLVALSDYLRYAVLSTNRVYSRVEEEMDNIEHYLDIEKLRFGEKLHYEADVAPECLQASIPAMLLQPLFENAIKHGVYESLQTVCIRAKIYSEGQKLFIELSNDYDSSQPSQKKGSGTGLQNVRERLRLLYGNSASLYTKAENGKFIVKIELEQ